jgi:hypothetical protein
LWFRRTPCRGRWWGDEFVAGAKVIAPIRSLVAVVKLVREVGGIIGMQDCRVAVFCRPHNAASAADGNLVLS